MKPEDVAVLFERCQAVGNQKSEGANRNLAGTMPSIASRSKAFQQLTDDEKEFMQYLVAALLPVIGRAEVDRFLPGLIKPQTLALADSAGLEPEIAWKVGRKVAIVQIRWCCGWLDDAASPGSYLSISSSTFRRRL